MIAALTVMAASALATGNQLLGTWTCTPVWEEPKPTFDLVISDSDNGRLATISGSKWDEIPNGTIPATGEIIPSTFSPQDREKYDFGEFGQTFHGRVPDGFLGLTAVWYKKSKSISVEIHFGPVPPREVNLLQAAKCKPKDILQ